MWERTQEQFHVIILFKFRDLIARKFVHGCKQDFP